MSVELGGTKWTTWDDVEKEMFTPEEIAESDLRVALIGELIKARQEKGISQKQLEELKRTCKTVTEFNERSKELNSFRLTVEKLEFLTQPMLDEAHRLFDEMELVADDEIVLRRVRRERLGLRYIELYLEDPKSPEHKANVDEFFADLKSHGIDRLSEGRLPEQSYEMMVQGIMRTWG